MLTDGSELVGTVVEEDSVSLVFNTLGNIPMTIPKSQVKTKGLFLCVPGFFPFVSAGIADFLTVGGGISLVPGSENQIVYLAPKVTPLHIQNSSAAAGLLYINTITGSEDGIGFYYAVATYGSQNAAATLGILRR